MNPNLYALGEVLNQSNYRERFSLDPFVFIKMANI